VFEINQDSVNEKGKDNRVRRAALIILKRPELIKFSQSLFKHPTVGHFHEVVFLLFSHFLLF